MGVDLGSFWDLTPHDLLIIADGYNKAVKRQIENDNTIAYLQGVYILEAILATVGNMFSDKNSKKHEYPDAPYDLNLDGKKSERENDSQLKLFAASLTNAMNNFNLRHPKEQG